MTDDVHAEDVNYWKSSTSDSDTWIQKAIKQIRDVGGRIIGEGFMRDSVTERSLFVLQFEIDDQKYIVKWPVLKSRTDNHGAAKRQAATMLYHDVKAKCMVVKVMGARFAFLPFMLLPDGRTAAEVAVPDLQLQLQAAVSGLLPHSTSEVKRD